MKSFNTTGVCIEKIHYMVDIDDKLNQIENLINKNSYFVINRPRQFGKTTTLSKLQQRLIDKYLVVRISFEGVGDKIFSDEEIFCKSIAKLFSKSIKNQDKEIYHYIKNKIDKLDTLIDLDDLISEFIENTQKEVILIIDEVDKSSKNEVFINFLGLLRQKYLFMMEDMESSFKSVILAGVNDVKSLKMKIRDDEEKMNSPWNIAVDFDIDMSFSILEIKSMLDEYSEINNLSMDTLLLSKEIHFFSSGYPYLVSRICKIIDEKIYNEKSNWSIIDVKKSVKILILEENTLFESILKNLENNDDLYNLIKGILVNSDEVLFNNLDITINKGFRYGLFKNEDGIIKIHNKIFEETIYNYMISKTNNKNLELYNFRDNFITNENGLDIKKILLKFQQYMKENYCEIDKSFIEREGRIIFMAFIRPIINGVGFAFKEVQISEEKRLDIVITYNNFKYIIELKLWRGQKYHEEGIKQLSNYLDVNNLDEGYLLVFNFNKNKEYKKEVVINENKEMFVCYV